MVAGEGSNGVGRNGVGGFAAAQPWGSCNGNAVMEAATTIATAAVEAEPVAKATTMVETQEAAALAEATVRR